MNARKTNWMMLIVAVVVASVLQSCSGSKETVGGKPAEQERNQAADRATDKALQHFIDGSMYEARGDYALRFDPNHAVYFAISKCYSRLNKQALAIEAAKEACRLSPEKTE